MPRGCGFEQLHGTQHEPMTTPATTSSPTLRQYDISARSTDTFGRVLCTARDHHFIVDGPVQNGCPGEAITPAELFLAGVATCGVELVQVLAKSAGIPLHGIAVDIKVLSIVPGPGPFRCFPL